MPTHFLSAKWDAEQRWGAEWSFQKWPKQTFTCLTCEHGWKIHQHQKSPIDQDWHKPPGQHLRRPTSSTRGQAPKIDPYKIPMSIKLLVLDKAGCRPGARGHGFAIADVAASPPFVGAMRILGPTPNKNKNNKHEARGIYSKPQSSASEKNWWHNNHPAESPHVLLLHIPPPSHENGVQINPPTQAQRICRKP